MRLGFSCFVLSVALVACGPASTSSDGGMPDGGLPDAGSADAGPDAGMPDAGSSDAGRDAGALDAGADGGADAGALDGGQCGFTWSYPDYYPCNTSADCMNGHCAFSLETSSGMPPPGICTIPCSEPGTDAGCESGFICDYAIEGESESTFCLPTVVSALMPQNGTLPLGSPCASNADCQGADAGTLCGLLQDSATGTSVSFCSPRCMATDPDACNGCGTCELLFVGEGDNCLPRGPGKVGAPCTTGYDCDTFVCADFCTAVCGVTGQETCPDNAECLNDGNMQEICVAASQVGATATGSGCEFDFQCPESNRCLPDTSGDYVCTQLSLYGESCASTSLCAEGLQCTPLDGTNAECTTSCPPACGIGSACVAPEMDTVISLYDGANQFDEIDSSSSASSPMIWSSMTDTLFPGTYWVEVTENTAFIGGYALQYVGGYTLSILDGVNTPIQITELPQDPVGNQSFSTAQVLPSVPAVITGSVSPASSPTSAPTDYYEFTVTSAVTLTFTTSAGAPSVCVPTGRDIGNQCWSDDNCNSQLCDPTLMTCTMICATDTDCGSGQHCVSNGSGQICVTASQYGHVASGGTCAFGWQCTAGNVCAQYGTHQVCGPLCDTAAGAGDGGGDAGTLNVGDAGFTACNPSTTECASVTATDPDGNMTTAEACVPLGNRMGAFGQGCVLQSDCATGLFCSGGICASTCMTSAQCPNQDLAPPAGDTSTDVCRPCQNDVDCSAGECVNGKGYERFCGDPCDADGGCPTGFSCVQADTEQVCAPDEGSCRPPVCQMDLCVVPNAGYAEACTQNSDCSTGSCINGLCTHTCQTTADCACPAGDLTCQSDECTWNPDYTAGASDATSMATAQTLPGSGPWSAYGILSPNTGVSEVYYSFTVSDAATVNIVTSPVCDVGSTGLSLALELWDSSGDFLNDSFPFESFPEITAYTLPAPGTYYVSVINFNGGTLPGAFVLNISAQ